MKRNGAFDEDSNDVSELAVMAGMLGRSYRDSMTQRYAEYAQAVAAETRNNLHIIKEEEYDLG